MGAESAPIPVLFWLINTPILQQYISVCHIVVFQHLQRNKSQARTTRVKERNFSGFHIDFCRHTNLHYYHAVQSR